MTVKELIEELSQYPPETECFCGTDHCESTDKVSSVTYGNSWWLNNNKPSIFIGGY